jgi:hypothetical protein
MTAQQERKQHIRAFMQAHYTDERLAQLLAHAQDGKLAYLSCCCLIGVRSAKHALQGRNNDWNTYSGHGKMSDTAVPGSGLASNAYAWLCGPIYDDAKRRRILIPMIRAEMKRRAALAAQSEVSTQAQRVAEPTR